MPCLGNWRSQREKEIMDVPVTSVLWCFYDFHLLCRRGIGYLCWKLEDFLFLWASWFLAGPANFYCWDISLSCIALENLWSPLFLTTLDSGLFPPNPQYQQCNSISYVGVSEFCRQLYFLCIKCCCYRIPGSPEYKRINYVSTQQHLSLKLAIFYLASA